ncbi:MAG: protein kinase [Candidatus Eremiobacteraeota bacterium]|nr:protein kinase [Candidatus Eremiobacteraeota bacterium]
MERRFNPPARPKVLPKISPLYLFAFMMFFTYGITISLYMLYAVIFIVQTWFSPGPYSAGIAGLGIFLFIIPVFSLIAYFSFDTAMKARKEDRSIVQFAFVSLIVLFILGVLINGFSRSSFNPLLLLAHSILCILLYLDRKCFLQGACAGTVEKAAHKDPATARAGEILNNRYMIEAVVGQGAAGTAFRVRDMSFPRETVHWVVKEIDLAGFGLAEKHESEALFEREKSFLLALNHPSIPKAVDFFTEGGRPHIVMEYVSGKTLSDLVREEGRPLEAGRVIDLGEGLLEILSYLHTREQAPLIYRDLKPDNVLVSEKGKLKLIDFGIARHVDPSKEKDTFIYGTPGFSPPEQYGTGQTDERSDIYAWGATLYYLLTLEDPQQFYFKFPPLRTLNRQVPRKLERILMKCLEKNPSSRYRTTEEVKRELLEARELLQGPAQHPDAWQAVFVGAAIYLKLATPAYFTGPTEPVLFLKWAAIIALVTALSRSLLQILQIKISIRDLIRNYFAALHQKLSPVKLSRS